MLHVACPAPTIVQRLARGGRPGEFTSDTLQRKVGGKHTVLDVTSGAVENRRTDELILPFTKVTPQSIDGQVIWSKGRRKYRDMPKEKPTKRMDTQTGNGSHVPTIGRRNLYTLGTFPMGRKGKYQVTEFEQCPPCAKYTKEDIPVWPDPTKKERARLAVNHKYGDIPELAPHIAKSSAMMMEWEQKKENGEKTPEPQWPVLWIDENKAWIFKPKWNDDDVLLDAPTSANSPEMLAELKGERFHQYTHYGNVPVTERSTLTDAPSDVRQTGETAASRARADKQRGEPQTAMPVTRGRTRWLVDSGTGNHLIWAKEIECRRKDIVKSDEALNLRTASCITVADERIPVKMKRLNTEITPLVLEYTPNALSLGRLVVEEGFSFTWEAYQPSPLLHLPEGKTISLPTEHLVPYIEESSGCGYACPMMFSAKTVADQQNAENTIAEKALDKLHRK